MTHDLNSRLHQDRLALQTLALMANGPCVAQLPAVAPLPLTERLMQVSSSNLGDRHRSPVLKGESK